MASRSRCLQIVRAGCLVLWGPAAFAQSAPAWVDPPAAPAASDAAPPAPMDEARNPLAAEAGVPASPAQVAPWMEPEGAQRAPDGPVSTSATKPAQPQAETGPAIIAVPEAPALPERSSFAKAVGLDRRHVARDFAFDYLNLWSAQNPVALSSAARFYGSSVIFHGQRRSFASVLAEKRRFAARWPERNYRYRPETTQVACNTAENSCTVWSIFDYSASDPRRQRRALGIGEHELVVSFANETPVIESENSRVLHRGPAPRH